MVKPLAAFGKAGRASRCAATMYLRTKTRDECKFVHDVTGHAALKLQTPNVSYSLRTAPLTSKIAFYIFIQQI